ncbi:MAG TPA: hypothetical protein DCM08_05525 [Microscillaceae bacterium]|nr:hypothetical protein [Microscillaceae bacterium]
MTPEDVEILKMIKSFLLNDAANNTGVLAQQLQDGTLDQQTQMQQRIEQLEKQLTAQADVVKLAVDFMAKELLAPKVTDGITSSLASLNNYPKESKSDIILQENLFFQLLQKNLTHTANLLPKLFKQSFSYQYPLQKQEASSFTWAKEKMGLRYVALTDNSLEGDEHILANLAMLSELNDIFAQAKIFDIHLFLDELNRRLAALYLAYLNKQMLVPQIGMGLAILDTINAQLLFSGVGVSLWMYNPQEEIASHLSGNSSFLGNLHTQAASPEVHKIAIEKDTSYFLVSSAPKIPAIEWQNIFAKLRQVSFEDQKSALTHRLGKQLFSSYASVKIVAFQL